MTAVTVWVDGDSCPRRLRDIVLGAAGREGVRVVVAADRPISVGGRSNVEFVQVPGGSGEVDEYLGRNAGPGDLAVTRDIGLAALLTRRKAVVIDDRGRVYTAENIQERLSVRRFMGGLRDQGVDTSTAGAPSPREVKAFADSLDRELTAALNRRRGGGV